MMEFEFTRTINASADRLWAILLDPDAMAECVPGMKSVEVISNTEYRARIQVKIAFISARFDIRTVITEMTPPSYLRVEATGEDSSVGSSVKSVSEIFMEPVDDASTELRVMSKATVLGRLGTLGLNPMRTKAERMWAQFCDNLETALADPAPQTDAPDDSATPPQPAATDHAARAADPAPGAASPRPSAIPAETGRRGGPLAGIRRWFAGDDAIRVELNRNGTTVILHWPSAQADQCLAWLDRQLKQDGGA